MPPILPPADAPRAPFRLGRRPERLAVLVGVTINVPLLKALVTAAAVAAGVSRAQMLGALRDKTITVHRHAGAWIAYHATARSLPEIGRAFSRDHSTVLHAIRATERRLADAPEETTAVIQQIVLHLLKSTPQIPLDVQIRAAAEAAKARQAEKARAEKSKGAARRPDECFTREVGSRGWFLANDARFCTAFVSAHPELVSERLEVPA